MCRLPQKGLNYGDLLESSAKKFLKNKQKKKKNLKGLHSISCTHLRNEKDFVTEGFLYSCWRNSLPSAVGRFSELQIRKTTGTKERGKFPYFMNCD
jgi:hypothetical protein